MSLCQIAKSSFSCGACCGILNFHLPKKELNDILISRTGEFNKDVNFEKKWTIAKFRKCREEVEKQYPVRDEQVYICPFLGKRNGKITCMIHPTFTKDANSQNFSFYGASICQGYECVNLKRKTSKLWEKFFENLNVDSLDYCGIAADYKLINLIEGFFEQKQTLINSLFFKKYQKLLKHIFLHKIEQKINMSLNSFEIDSSSIGNNYFENLVHYLSLKPHSKIYNELKNI